MSHPDQDPLWLLDFRKNVHSQCGEDGVLAKILELIPDKNNWCVEFGAYDGEHLSNTCNLIEEKNYNAILIESDPKKFKLLTKRFANKMNIHPFNCFVGFSKDDSLDKILINTPIPDNFDFLSIDIDGNDYHVWKAVDDFFPKIVCIEFNPTMPTELRFVQAPDPRIAIGSSLLSLVELGKQKGYELVCVLPVNAIFVRKEYFGLFGIVDNSPFKLRIFNDAVTYFFQSTDGSIILDGYNKFFWHYLPINAKNPKSVPWFLSGFPGNYGLIRKIIWTLYGLLVVPEVFREILNLRKKGLWDGVPVGLNWTKFSPALESDDQETIAKS